MKELLDAIAGQESAAERCEIVTVAISESNAVAGPDDGYIAGDPPPNFSEKILPEPPTLGGGGDGGDGGDVGDVGSEGRD